MCLKLQETFLMGKNINNSIYLYFLRKKLMEELVMKLKIIVILIFMCNLFITTPTIAAEFGENSANINTTFLPAKVGTSHLKTGYGEKSFQYEYVNILKPDVIDGVKCIKVISIRTEASEFTEAWVAQDVLGSVYVLKYWDGTTPAPVVLGKNNALLFMPKTPKVGDKILGGDDTVIAIGVTVPKLTTGLGPFTNCLKIMEADGDIVYFAPGIGEIKKEYSDQSGWELKEIFGSKSRVVVIPLFD